MPLLAFDPVSSFRWFVFVLEISVIHLSKIKVLSQLDSGWDCVLRRRMKKPLVALSTPSPTLKILLLMRLGRSSMVNHHPRRHLPLLKHFEVRTWSSFLKQCSRKKTLGTIQSPFASLFKKIGELSECMNYTGVEVTSRKMNTRRACPGYLGQKEFLDFFQVAFQTSVVLCFQV